MDIDTYELRCPAELIETISMLVPLTEGAAYMALVHDPSRRQVVREVVSLPCGSEIDDESVAGSIIEDVCRSWDLGRSHRPSELKVATVLVRRGLCVWTPLEWAWSNAWRYASTGLSGGDLITVTEHGWYDFMTKHADHQPALIAS